MTEHFALQLHLSFSCRLKKTPTHLLFLEQNPVLLTQASFDSL